MLPFELTAGEILFSQRLVGQHFCHFSQLKIYRRQFLLSDRAAGEKCCLLSPSQATNFASSARRRQKILPFELAAGEQICFLSAPQAKIVAF